MSSGCPVCDTALQSGAPSPGDALEGQWAPKGGFKSSCEGGYRRLEQWLGGDVWRLQTGGRASGGGWKRLAGRTVMPNSAPPPRSSSARLHPPAGPRAVGQFKERDMSLSRSTPNGRRVWEGAGFA